MIRIKPAKQTTRVMSHYDQTLIERTIRKMKHDGVKRSIQHYTTTDKTRYILICPNDAPNEWRVILLEVQISSLAILHQSNYHARVT